MLKFGFPRILHSDNGMEFKSKLIEPLSLQLGIKKTYTSPYILPLTTCKPTENNNLPIGLLKTAFKNPQ